VVKVFLKHRKSLYLLVLRLHRNIISKCPYILENIRKYWFIFNTSNIRVCNFQLYWAHFILTYSLRTLASEWSGYDKLWLCFDYGLYCDVIMIPMLISRCTCIDRYCWWVPLSVQDTWQVEDVYGINGLPWTTNWVKEWTCIWFEFWVLIYMYIWWWF